MLALVQLYCYWKQHKICERTRAFEEKRSPTVLGIYLIGISGEVQSNCYSSKQKIFSVASLSTYLAVWSYSRKKRSHRLPFLKPCCVLYQCSTSYLCCSKTEEAEGKSPAQDPAALEEGLKAEPLAPASTAATSHLRLVLGASEKADYSSRSDAPSLREGEEILIHWFMESSIRGQNGLLPHSTGLAQITLPRQSRCAGFALVQLLLDCQQAVGNLLSSLCRRGTTLLIGKIMVKMSLQ